MALVIVCSVIAVGEDCAVASPNGFDDATMIDSLQSI